MNDKNVQEDGFDAYGDIKIRYTDRDGRDKSAYVCDYEWNMEAATSICKYLGYVQFQQKQIILTILSFLCKILC